VRGIGSAGLHPLLTTPLLVVETPVAATVIGVFQALCRRPLVRPHETHRSAQAVTGSSLQ